MKVTIDIDDSVLQPLLEEHLKSSVPIQDTIQLRLSLVAKMLDMIEKHPEECFALVPATMKNRNGAKELDLKLLLKT